jgi:hypothetical protein
MCAGVELAALVGSAHDAGIHVDAVSVLEASATMGIAR